MIKKEQLKKGKTYKAYSPKGKEIKGTYDLIPACGLASSFEFTGHSLEPNYDGESKIYWDGQYVDTQDNELLYQCVDGNPWKESELLFEEVKE